MIASSALQRMLLLVLVALLVAIGAVILSSRNSGGKQPTSQFNGPTLPPGLHAADFSLRDPSGRVVTLSRYRGHVVVLTFIHSRCHDACPFMVEQIKGALGDLPDGGRSVPTIGISVAPSEDTPASRSRFLIKHQMEGRLQFLSGALPALKEVWHEYAIEPVTPKVDHSTFVLLIDKQGFERVGFPADQLTPEGLAHDIRVLEAEPA